MTQYSNTIHTCWKTKYKRNTISKLMWDETVQRHWAHTKFEKKDKLHQ